MGGMVMKMRKRKRGLKRIDIDPIFLLGFGSALLIVIARSCLIGTFIVCYHFFFRTFV